MKLRRSTDNPTRDELFRLIGRSEARSEAQKREKELLAALLRGEGVVMGFPVQLTFPGGPPMGLSNEELAALIEPRGVGFGDNRKDTDRDG